MAAKLISMDIKKLDIFIGLGQSNFALAEKLNEVIDVVNALSLQWNEEQIEKERRKGEMENDSKISGRY